MRRSSRMPGAGREGGDGTVDITGSGAVEGSHRFRGVKSVSVFRSVPVFFMLNAVSCR
jgi:hypothetical protein